MRPNANMADDAVAFAASPDPGGSSLPAAYQNKGKPQRTVTLASSVVAPQFLNMPCSEPDSSHAPT
jgi:hypothetical protein